MSLVQRDFGNTGLKVPILGFGAGQIGDHRIAEKVVEITLHTILDYGITLIDTARGYGASEERIGKYLAHRRDEFVLSTKIGYGIPDYQDWTADCITAGIDTALRMLRTDHIDIVHLHSCPLETLEKTDLIDALSKAVAMGKVGQAAYSGENEALTFAINSGLFTAVMTSVNICDQRAIFDHLPSAMAKGMGVIAKRPLANTPWRFKTRPLGDYCETYWLRLEKMGLKFDMDWEELALRFAVFTPGVASSVAGTTNLAHIKQNIAMVEKGALPTEMVAMIHNAFQQNDDNWLGQI